MRETEKEREGKRREEGVTAIKFTEEGGGVKFRENDGMKN